MAKIDLTKEIAENVRERRQDAGMSQFRLACRAGVTVQTILNVEKRNCSQIRQATFNGLADALGIDTEELEGYEDSPILLSGKTIKNIEQRAMDEGYGDDVEAYLDNLFARG